MACPTQAHLFSNGCYCLPHSHSHLHHHVHLGWRCVEMNSTQFLICIFQIIVAYCHCYEAHYHLDSHWKWATKRLSHERVFRYQHPVTVSFVGHFRIRMLRWIAFAPCPASSSKTLYWSLIPLLTASLKTCGIRYWVSLPIYHWIDWMRAYLSSHPIMGGLWRLKVSASGVSRFVQFSTSWHFLIQTGLAGISACFVYSAFSSGASLCSYEDGVADGPSKMCDHNWDTAPFTNLQASSTTQLMHTNR